MVTYASSRVAVPVDVQTHRSLLSEDRIQLWSAMQQTLNKLTLAQHNFPEPLGFLSDLEFE